MRVQNEKAKCRNSSHVISMEIPKQGHTCDMENFVMSSNFPLKSGKVTQV